MVKAKRQRKRQGFDFARDWRHINYLQPVYDELGGNSTIINLGLDKTVKDRRTIKSVLKSLAKEFAVDLGETKKKYGAVVCRRSSAPIPLNSSLVLLPIKMRHSLIKGDGAWGYVVLDKIKDWGEVLGDEGEDEAAEDETAVVAAGDDSAESTVEKAGVKGIERVGEYRSMLAFHDGTRLATMVNQVTIYSLIKDGEMARKKYVELLHPNVPASDAIQEAKEQYLRSSCQIERMIKILEEWIKKIN
ncbi:MAG: hypothetical protein KGZ96_10795 [Clostridia bacterium]|nr:hypothetical protein [Clostridia bacterium]